MESDFPSAWQAPELRGRQRAGRLSPLAAKHAAL